MVHIYGTCILNFVASGPFCMGFFEQHFVLHFVLHFSYERWRISWLNGKRESEITRNPKNWVLL